MPNGWIKLYRKMLDWEWFSEPSTTSLFLYFLLSANPEDKQWKGMVVKRGQFVTSINSACEKCGITPRAFRTSLKRLIATKEVTSKTTSKYTIITICNYDCYQFQEGLSDKANDKVNDKECLSATHCVSDSYEHSEGFSDKVNDKRTTNERQSKRQSKRQTKDKENDKVNDKASDKVNDKEGLSATHCVSDSYEHSEGFSDKVNDKESDKANDKVTTSKTTKQTTKQTTTTKNNIDNIRHVTDVTCLSSPSNEEDDSSLSSTRERIDFSGFADFFNSEMDKHKAVIPRVTKISGQRKQMVSARHREYTKRQIADVVIKAAESDFLNGKNSRGFVADFNWIFRPNNFPKILEGNYDNNKANGNATYRNDCGANVGSQKAAANAIATAQAQAAFLRVVNGVESEVPDF